MFAAKVGRAGEAAVGPAAGAADSAAVPVIFEHVFTELFGCE